jgi:acyl carrier protein
MGPHPDAVLAELTRLLTRICEHDQAGLSADTTLDEIPGIDSLRLLQAVAHLEERFDVEIDVGALDDLHRVHDIVNAISTARPAA